MNLLNLPIPLSYTSDFPIIQYDTIWWWFGTSSILLNGVPGKTFHCKREVRQGDPLSPLPFVLAADFLQELLNKAKEMNLLNLPIPLSYTSDFPIINMMMTPWSSWRVARGSLFSSNVCYKLMLYPQDYKWTTPNPLWCLSTLNLQEWSY
jgi:hypothetical protein